jgi:glycosyltransferase involved in cell wall biosynthesis
MNIEPLPPDTPPVLSLWAAAARYRVATDTLLPTCRILALAGNPWDGQWMNRQQILSRLAKAHRVLYSTGPWSIWERETPECRAAPLMGAFEARDGALVDQPPRLLLSWPNRAAWERVVTAVAVRRWRKELGRLGSGPLVAYLFHPRYLAYAETLRPDFLIYSPFDLFSLTPDWTPTLAAAEDRLLRLADITITSSRPTRDALRERTRKPVVCVPNGADPEPFIAGAQAPEPADMARIPHPRIGYVGSVNRKVDLPMIATLAEREPAWQFIFVGPVFSHDDVTGPALARCRELPNVHFLAARPKEAMPAAMAALDIGIMCYRSGTWMDAAYPLKLHEYLASGLPVVSADLPAISEFRNLIDMAVGTDEWHHVIRRVLAGGAHGSPEARRIEARRNTWNSRVDRITELLAQLLERRSGNGMSGTGHGLG